MREREVFSSASEIHKWHSKQSKAVYDHASGNLNKETEKQFKNSKSNSQTTSKLRVTAK